MQRKNDCAGGMMEEWHQKLHNNTSPDDVVICQVCPSCLTVLQGTFCCITHLKSAMFFLCLCGRDTYSQSCILLEILKITLFQLTYPGTSRAHQEWLQNGCLLEDLE